MKDCWNEAPRSRLTALRIKKTLGSLMERLDDEKQLSCKSLLEQSLLSDLHERGSNNDSAFCSDIS